ncbi:hypothetical protein [Companilactobacillus ginsenosidimutans]|uniref:Uncharacterized protein n=1 Tax=Companilactobacillus ginsenosidimutans TaxID=1007676 RepID=A0A0H4R1K9_9LACO|nr:hypothetical protein [Companilactobacillus ginsenosidimutans]AKP67620.1 hypothetical protein ABM34_08805 [Companilactobacillus ginsenosidimutans]
MKKLLALIFTSLSLLLAGTAALSVSTSQASNIETAPSEIAFNNCPETSHLVKVSNKVNVTISSDDFGSAAWTYPNTSNEGKLRDNLMNVSVKQGGLKYNVGDSFVAAKYSALDGSMAGQTLYLVNRPDFPNTFVYLMHNKYATTFTEH